jgi:Flp pilus assembly protein TadG
MNKKSEVGQAMIFIVIGFIVILGFVGLAIDGGMVFSDRRHAQNAADASSLAAGGKAPSTWKIMA